MIVYMQHEIFCSIEKNVFYFSFDLDNVHDKVE